MATRTKHPKISSRERLQMDTWEPPAPDVEQKFCKKCQQWKNIDEFFKRGAKSKYYAAYCKNCHSKPFEYESIHCPHCKGRVVFFGLDTDGNVVKQKSAILNKLKDEAKESLKKKNVKKDAEDLKAKLDLKDFFDE